MKTAIAYDRQTNCRGRLGLAGSGVVARTIRQLAFSLIEILVTISLLSVIVLGLLMMFNQTQRAFRGSMTQTDVLESGRILMGLIARDVEQMAPSGEATWVNNGTTVYTTNFYVETPNFASPLRQGLPGTTADRVNYLQTFFLLSSQNQDWTGTGYVLQEENGPGVGTLYRFNMTAPVRHSGYNLSAAFRNTPATNMSRIADGIVHFRVRAYATNGHALTRIQGANAFAAFHSGALPADSDGGLPGYSRVWNTIVSDPNQFSMYFVSNAVPAVVELELGILEPQVLQRYHAIGDAVAKRTYLSNHVAQVHLFRQRVPVRNVDYSAYQ